MLGAILLTTINLAYYQELMAGMRAAISTRRVRGFPRGSARRLGPRRHLDQLKNSVEEPSTAYLVRHKMTPTRALSPEEAKRRVRWI